MDLLIFRFIAVLVVYVPLENILLKYLPVPNFIYSLLRFAPELILYAALLFLLHFRLTCKQRLIGSPIDKYVALFLVSVSCSAVLNHSGWLESVFALRPLLRYLTVFYLLMNITLGRKQVQFLVGLILLSGGIQVFFGILQDLGGTAVSNLFFPKKSNLEIGGHTKEFVLVEQGREFGSIFGSIGDTVTYGVFLIIILAVVLSTQRNLGIRTVSVIGVLIAVIALSYSRASTFAALLAVFVWTVFTQSRIALVGVSLITITATGFWLASSEISGPYVNPRFEQQSISENLTRVFSTDYLERARNQRLGLLVGVLPAVLTTRPLFGFGPDQDATIDAINRTRSKYLTKEWTRDGFKDVYWVSLVSFFGVLGTGFFALIFASLFRNAVWVWNTRSENHLIRNLALCTLITIIITSFLMFFVRLLEFRAYSFYFWTLAGVFLSVSGRRNIPAPADDR